MEGMHEGWACWAMTPPPPPTHGDARKRHPRCMHARTFPQPVAAGGQVGHAVGAVHDAERPRGEEGERRRKDRVPDPRLPESVEQGPEPEAHAQVGGAERGSGGPCRIGCVGGGGVEGPICYQGRRERRHDECFQDAYRGSGP